MTALLAWIRKRPHKNTQGCTLAEPGGPWRPTVAPGQLENLTFLYKSYAGHPGFYRLRALGSLQFSLEQALIHISKCLFQSRTGL